FALSGKVSRLELRGENHDEKFAAAVREITVFAVSDELRLAERPREDAVTGESIELETAVDGLEPGRHLAVTGSAIDSGGSDAGASGGSNVNASGCNASNGSASGSSASNGNASRGVGGELAEIVTLARVEAAGERSRLVLEPPGLVGRYRRDSERINANVAPANHGETVRQILGSG